MKYLLLFFFCVCAHAQVAPPEHRRGPEQTFLTYPEWFLVHSPAEYAEYVSEHTPTRFPFIGHTCQFWQGYAAVTRATRDFPFNFRYHVMVMVIGTSTSVEYVMRAAYETMIGRLSELAAPRRLGEEDRYAAKVAQDYVDFIRDQPWYEYDFTTKLAGLWKDTSLFGPDFVRKWERKYALTTEYLIKGGYAWLIKKATKAAYDEPLPVTAVVIDGLPAGAQNDLSEIKVLTTSKDSALILLPRYYKFKQHAAGIAAKGGRFREIAGNGANALILVSALVPADWQSDGLVFEQPVLTRPQTKRAVLAVPVGSLATLLNRLASDGARLEHVYDY
jgi:hypothetical protein